MLKDIVAVEHLGGHRLRLRFSDGLEGELDMKPRLSFTGVFASLAAPDVFAEVRVDTDSGTICWPGGADLDPDVLYAAVSGTALPDGRSSAG